MKLIKIICIVLIITSFIKLSYQSNNSNNKEQSDLELEKIRTEIYNLARDKIKSSDVYKKARGSGNFANNYNKLMRNRGKDSRKIHNLWGFMMDVVEVYEFCINPFYKVNYVKWCNNAFLGNNMKNDGKYIY